MGIVSRSRRGDRHNANNVESTTGRLRILAYVELRKVLDLMIFRMVLFNAKESCYLDMLIMIITEQMHFCWTHTTSMRRYNALYITKSCHNPLTAWRFVGSFQLILQKTEQNIYDAI